MERAVFGKSATGGFVMVSQRIDGIDLFRANIYAYQNLSGSECCLKINLTIIIGRRIIFRYEIDFLMMVYSNFLIKLQRVTSKECNQDGKGGTCFGEQKKLEFLLFEI